MLSVENEWKAGLEKIPQVKSLPDPMLSVSHFGRSVETRLGPQRNKISLSQKIPFFGKLNLRGKVAASHADILKEQYFRIKAEVTARIKEIYYTIYWFDTALKISGEEKDILNRLARIARKKYEAGNANQQNALKAQLEISRVADKVLRLQQGRQAAVTGLNYLLNRPQETAFQELKDIAVPFLSLNLGELLNMAEEGRPELKRAQKLVIKNEWQLKLAKKNYYPDFNFMLDYIDIGGGATSLEQDGRNAWMGSVGINIPLWRKKLHASEAEAKIRLEAGMEDYRAAWNDTKAQVNELFHDIKTYEEQLKLYKFSMLPQAEQASRASEIAYVAGKVDFLNILDRERMVLQIKTGYYKILSDLWKSLSRLERIVGRELVG